MASSSPETETVLKQELNKKGFELVSFSAPDNDRDFEVQANILHPVTLPQSDQLFVPVPVTLHVSVDDKNQIRHIDGGTPPKEVTDDAVQFIKTLHDNNQISGLAGQPAHNATHQIEVNEKGQQVVKRRGFSLY